MTALPEDSLVALGFTELEARLYVALLQHSPQTGYALAKRVGKAAANVYQALAALAQRGAVLLEEGPVRSARALPPDELLAHLGGRFEARRSAAADALRGLYAEAPQDRLYHLQTVEQVMDKAQAMLARVRSVVLFDLFPEPLAALAPALERVRQAGAHVAGLAYAPAGYGFDAVPAPRPERSLAHWPGQQLTLVVDASEFLLALISRDGNAVVHGLWSDSVYLSCVQHNGLACEIALGAMSASTPIDNALASSLLSSAPPGLRRLTHSLPED